MLENMTAHVGLRQGLWSGADCDLDVFRHVPRELALAVVSGVVRQNRDELARELARLHDHAIPAREVLAEIEDVSPIAEAIRRRKAGGPPRRSVLATLCWKLRRAAMFLNGFSPDAALDDPVLGDRILDLLAKIEFLSDLARSWNSPPSSSRRKTG